MKIIGLINESNIRRYLLQTYGMSVVDENEILKIFKNEDEYLLGGYKNFYSLLPDTPQKEIKNLINLQKNKYKNIYCNISTPYNLGTRLINYVLDLKNIDDTEKRFDLYEKKTRNLVRKSYKNDFRIDIGKTPDDFYKLYSLSVKRLGGFVKDKNWFNNLEQILFENIIVFSLYDEGKLIGVNYCLTSKEYVLLMFNVSDPDYWQYAVNDRLYDELVSWSIANSIQYLDFGPAVLGDKSHNHFKAGFGAKRWYILNKRFGTVLYRFYPFWKAKKHNFILRLKKISKK